MSTQHGATLHLAKKASALEDSHFLHGLNSQQDHKDASPQSSHSAGTQGLGILWLDAFNPCPGSMWTSTPHRQVNYGTGGPLRPMGVFVKGVCVIGADAGVGGG